MNTFNPAYSPWSLLPAPEPRTVSPPADYFYENVAKHLVKDTVRICSNGLGIDLNEVSKLEDTIDSSINKVHDSLLVNPIILQYLNTKHSKELESYKAERATKLRTIDYYIKPFDHKNMHHRSYFMYFFSQSQGFKGPPDEIHPGIPKWDANTVKKLTRQYPLLTKLLNGTLTDAHPLVKQALELLAQHKCDIYNQKFLEQIANPSIPKPLFNPRSPDAKHLVFTDILGYESGKLTDGYKKYERELEKAQRRNSYPPKEPKNKWSWGRKQLEQLKDIISDPDETNLVTDMIEFSFGDKIKSSFIPAFYKYTVNGRLYSNLKLLGAKSARFTSSNPNMLQLPSTGSIYAKPVKKCFVASPGNVILTADFAALEDRILASITRDVNKCAIFTDNIDGHSLGAVSYYPDKINKEFQLTGDLLADARQFKQLVDSGNKSLADLRQIGKAVTFKLAYQGLADADRGGVITEEMYNNYHTTLYPGVRKYIDEYVLPTAKSTKRLHLGLGFYIYTDNPDKDYRTLHNATIQFWSILSILAINELHRRIDLNNLQNEVKVISSIYDSIYIECTADPEIIKWTNDNLIECMIQDFMPEQQIHNEAISEIGLNWAELHKIPNNASLEQIQSTLQIIYEGLEHE